MEIAYFEAFIGIRNFDPEKVLTCTSNHYCVEAIEVILATKWFIYCQLLSYQDWCSYFGPLCS